MFDYFAKEKSDFLKKKDKSKKGCIDKNIIEIITLINSKKDYYTTSSCAGRIVLLEMKSKRKDECNWLFTKHDKVNFTEIFNSLRTYQIKNKKIRELPLKVVRLYASQSVNGFMPLEETSFKYPVWFKQQPIILHVACRNLDAAKKLLDGARKVFKHSGIIGITDKKVTIEIIGSERIETIVAEMDFAADEKYIKNLVKYANMNFDDNKRKSDRLLRIIQEI